MGPKEIQRLANALGIPSAHPSNMRTIIHSIQLQEGLMPCLSEAWSTPCRVDECPFSAACSSYLGTGTKHQH